MKKFATLVLREIWEHHNLWRVPLILLVLVVLANIGFSGAAPWLGLAPPEVSSQVVGPVLGSLGSVVFFVFSFLVLFYLVDCLYAERKDKSILFWRSLPVSDTQAVLAKLSVAAVVIPLIIWVTIIVSHLVTLAIQSVSGDSGSSLFSLIDLSVYWRNLLIILLLTSLWTLPLQTWFLFCSSWSKRTPFVAAVTIPVVIMLLDQILSTGIGLGGLIADRIPFGHRFGGGESGLLFGLLGITSSYAGEITMSQFLVFFRQPGLWAGLVVATGFAALTVWTRRWRDDS
jgi:ABC-2 type transport system permease protein